MHRLVRGHLLAVVLVIAVGLVACGASSDGSGQSPTISDASALSSFISLSDGYLVKMVDSLGLLARTDEAQTVDWGKIKPLLAEVATRNVSALNWFALPDGSYWSVQNGQEAASLSTRDYFPKVLAGGTVIGDLVVSKATGKPVAIIAVPVSRQEGEIVGVLGASVYLDQLSQRISEDMGLDKTSIFYSFDQRALVALDWDPALVFFEPMTSGDEGLQQAFEQMLSSSSGTVSYVFRGAERTVTYRKSTTTGWWYAFGTVKQ